LVRVADREQVVSVNWRVWTRKGHRWGAITIAAPFLVVICSGLLLQLKKHWSWVQPVTCRGHGSSPRISFDNIFETVKRVPEADVAAWADIERLDVQPNRGLVKVQCKNRWEVQLDLHDASVLQVAYRRSDIIESLHDGSFFHDQVKLWIFLPTAFVVAGLWLTGIYLFFLPLMVRWRRPK
jgi:hypothetical protein